MMSIAIALAGALCASAQNAQPKYSFEFGMGANTPAGGSTGTYQTTNIGFQAGVGRNLNSRVGAQVEYDFNRFLIPDSVVSNYCSACAYGTVVLQSFSFDPYVNLIPEGRIGVYLIGGPGYYWKHTAFVAPTGQEACFTLSGCIPTGSTVSSWTTSAFGVNAGGGVTVRLVSRMKLFAEGRYVWVHNQGSSSATPAYPPANYGVNFFSTSMGIRF